MIYSVVLDVPAELSELVSEPLSLSVELSELVLLSEPLSELSVLSLPVELSVETELVGADELLLSLPAPQ